MSHLARRLVLALPLAVAGCAALVGIEDVRDDGADAATADAATDLAAPDAPALDGGADTGFDVGAEADVAAFEKIATYPPAAAQLTAVGRVLATLQPFQGRLYIGYGDYSVNTGPIEIGAFDPTTSSFRKEFLADTEAIWGYRVIGDQLYAPHIDPRPGEGGLQYEYSVGPPWREDQIGVSQGGVLNYDIAAVGGTRYLAGEDYTTGNATVWESPIDGGRDGGWTVSLSKPSRQLYPDGGAIVPDSGVLGAEDARFHFIAVLGPALLVQAVDYTGGVQPDAWYHSGGWGPYPAILPEGRSTGSPPTAFKGQVAFPQYFRIAPGQQLTRGTLFASDGRLTRNAAPWEVRTIAASDTTLYAVSVDGNVYRTTDLSTWTLVAPGPVGAFSIAAMGGVLYVGTADSELWRLNVPAP